MSPLAHRSPAELFGADAVLDLQQLKRAYARLLRDYGPDKHPEAFAHIRMLYEQAKEALEEGSEAPTAPREPEQDDQELSERLARCTADQIDAFATWLEARAQSEGSEAAVITRLALHEATTPERSLDWLRQLAAHPQLHSLSVQLAHYLLDIRSHHAISPDWPGLLEVVTESHRAELVAHRLQTLLNIGEPEVAQAQWRDHGPLLRRTNPRLWAMCAQRMLLHRNSRLPAADLARLAEDFDAVDLELSVEEYDHLRELLDVAVALQAAEQARSVPAYVLDTIRDGLAADSPTRTMLLMNLIAQRSAPEQALRDLRHHFPVLHKQLDDLRESLSGSSQFALQWLVSGEVPKLPVTIAPAALDRLRRSIAEHNRKAARPNSEFAIPQTFSPGLRSYIPIAAVIGVVANQAGASTPMQSVWIALLLLMVGVSALLLLWHPLQRWISAWIEGRKPHYGLLTGEPVEQTLAWLRLLGIFPHELAAMAAATGDQAIRDAATELLRDPYADLRALSTAHLERILRAAATSAATKEESKGTRGDHE